MIIFTKLVTCAIIVGCAYTVNLARTLGAISTSLVITTFNSIVPMILRRINKFEKHPYESHAAASRYIKFTFFRWVNTAIIITVITPFADTLLDGKRNLIQSIQAIFITEMIKRPFTQYINLTGIWKRHIMGPRAPNQRQMNTYYIGSYFELEDKFTDITKIIFLAVFYALIYPIGFLWAFIALVANYWVDKFSILRIWRHDRTIGKQVSELSSRYFFPLCSIGYAVMAAYFYSRYPYDNACLVENATVPSKYAGNYDITVMDGTTKKVNITLDSPVFDFCYQNLIHPRGLPLHFPPRPNELWMTEPQMLWTRIFGWTCVSMVVVVGFVLFIMTFGAWLWDKFLMFLNLCIVSQLYYFTFCNSFLHISDCVSLLGIVSLLIRPLGIISLAVSLSLNHSVL